MIGGIDWSAVGAIATVLTLVFGVLGGLAKWIVGEVRKNRTEIDSVNRRVTTPSSVEGTIGETVAGLAVDTRDHFEADERQFRALWSELGKEPPS